VISGEVLVAAAAPDGLVPSLAEACRALGVNTLAHPCLPSWTARANALGMMTGPWRVGAGQGARLKGLIFDASRACRIEHTADLHRVFQEALPSLQACARVIVLGLAPEACQDPEHATTQRALDGFIRSLAKELRRGATAQLILVSRFEGVDLRGCLGFLLSPRSAYVSGQSLRMDAPAGRPLIPDVARPLLGRTVLVTGAARGIGRAIADTLARDGARVLALDMPAQQAPLQAWVEGVDGRAIILDITSPDAASSIASVVRDEGGLDGIVHNAGITRDRTIARMPLERWQSVLSVNLKAPFAIQQALLSEDLLKGGARIVAVSSIAGIAGNRGQTHYAYSKAGLIGMVQALAPGLAARGVAINAVAPGFIETEMTASMPWFIRELGRRLNSLGQGGQPEDVAEAVAWLAGPDSEGVNAQVLRICGQSLLGA
jgi:3-oxoacyl-[acyl-carrier protein] reductase